MEAVVLALVGHVRRGADHLARIDEPDLVRGRTLDRRPADEAGRVREGSARARPSSACSTRTGYSIWSPATRRGRGRGRTARRGCRSSRAARSGSPPPARAKASSGCSWTTRPSGRRRSCWSRARSRSSSHAGTAPTRRTASAGTCRGRARLPAAGTRGARWGQRARRSARRARERPWRACEDDADACEHCIPLSATPTRA